MRLVGILVDQWDALDGFAAAQGLPDLGEMEIGRLCNLVYYRTTEPADHESVEKFRARLWQPPRGEVADKRSPWSSENENASFNSARAALGLTIT